MKRGIVDLSSVIWTCLLGGKDKEFGRTVLDETGKEKFVNSASYGYECVMNHMKVVLRELGLQPMDLIFVAEGKNNKALRQAMHADYKSSTTKLPEQYDEFNKCKDMVMEAFLGVGSSFVWQDGGVEADDVIAYLVVNLAGERYIVSGDKDCAVSVAPSKGIHHWRAGEMDKNPFGEFPHKLIPVCIALVGDSADKIPGADGFGPTTWKKLEAVFGDYGIEQLEELIKTKQLQRLEEDITDLAKQAEAQTDKDMKRGLNDLSRGLRKVVDDAQGVYTSYELARPLIDKVNTVRRPLTWRVGMVKPRTACNDESLRAYAGVIKLVAAEQYAEALPWLQKQFNLSPWVALDIEGSTPEESDEWLERAGKDDKVDVMGSEITSLQLTFGPNMQYTVYLPIDNVEEPGVTNLTISQVRDVVDMIPRNKITWVHNAAYELPVCYNAWGADWAEHDLLYNGFLRNVRDSRIAGSYVDENKSQGLKDRSLELLGYQQQTFDDVTTKTYAPNEWNGKGKVLGREYFDADGDEEPKVKSITVQHKMNQLTARHVLQYGADDTICTAAIANHFRVVMEMEQTWDAFEQIETYPAYLCALAFVQGTGFSLETMAKMEREDDATYEENWAILREFLMKIGFEGTRCPVYEELTAANVKEAFSIITGQEMHKTQVRTMSKLAILIRNQVEDWDDELEKKDAALLLAELVQQQELGRINELLTVHFKGEPKLDLGSPKQMKVLLYDNLRIPVRVINDVTDIEYATNKPLADAVSIFKKVRAGSKQVVLTDEHRKLLRQKAKSDDTAVDMAVAFDTDVLDDDARAALKALGKMKKVMTRRNLFYTNWRNAIHWKTGKIHSSHNQCAAVTRRYSSSFPNDQQLPKKGDGATFRKAYIPHKKNAVVASIDYIGQELRLAAEVSQDKNMLACYVGDKLKDIHSITAAGAMNLKWGKQKVTELFDKFGVDIARDEEGTYDLFRRLHKMGKAEPIGKEADDLRKDSKNVNFGAQNGAMAAKLAETLIMPYSDAQLFLDARAIMFPDVAVAAEEAAQEALRLGYVTTLMGVRRHLREAMQSTERGAANRAARQAWNFKIQGSAAEMTKLGMARMWLSRIFFRYDARFIAPIHDECVTSVVEHQAADFLREKHACMAQPYATMKVPVLGSISFGPDFKHQHEVGDDWDPYAIEGGLAIGEGEVPKDIASVANKNGINPYRLYSLHKIHNMDLDAALRGELPIKESA